MLQVIAREDCEWPLLGQAAIQKRLADVASQCSGVAVRERAPTSIQCALRHENAVRCVIRPLIQPLRHLLGIGTETLPGQDIDVAVRFASHGNVRRTQPDTAVGRGRFHGPSKMASLEASKLAKVPPSSARRFNNGAGSHHSPC